MPRKIIFGGVEYRIPIAGEMDWGQNVDDLLNAYLSIETKLAALFQDHPEIYMTYFGTRGDVAAGMLLKELRDDLRKISGLTLTNTPDALPDGTVATLKLDAPTSAT